MEEYRRRAAEKATEYLKDGMVIGLGTGRTASYAIRKIGKLVRAGMKITAVSTSDATTALAEAEGINVSSLDEHPIIDVTIDGADEVDPSLDLVKGKGGALLREKIIAYSTKDEIIVVDESKLVGRLGEKEAIPVEILKFGYLSTVSHLSDMGCSVTLRTHDGHLFVTDNGNYIADCRFSSINQPYELHSRINTIPGVIDNGMFLGMAARVLVGREREVTVLERKRR